jgi:hypothetical protein
MLIQTLIIISYLFINTVNSAFNTNGRLSCKLEEQCILSYTSFIRKINILTQQDQTFSSSKCYPINLPEFTGSYCNAHSFVKKTKKCFKFLNQPGGDLTIQTTFDNLTTSECKHLCDAQNIIKLALEKLINKELNSIGVTEDQHDLNAHLPSEPTIDGNARSVSNIKFEFCSPYYITKVPLAKWNRTLENFSVGLSAEALKVLNSLATTTSAFQSTTTPTKTTKSSSTKKSITTTNTNTNTAKSSTAAPTITTESSSLSSSTTTRPLIVGWWVILGILLVLLCIFGAGTTIWWFFIRDHSGHEGYNPV